MKYSTVLFLASGAYAASTTLATEAATEAADAGVTAAPVPVNSVAQCISSSCALDDVKCRASCGSVPAPNSAQAQGNVDCVATTCIPLQTDVPAYSKCLDVCRDKWYYNPTAAGGLPGNSPAQPTGSSGSGSGSGSGSDSDSGDSGSEGSGSDSEGSGSEANASANASATGSSAGNKVTFSVAGVLGAVGLIAFAL